MTYMNGFVLINYRSLPKQNIYIYNYKTAKHEMLPNKRVYQNKWHLSRQNKK